MIGSLKIVHPTVIVLAAAPANTATRIGAPIESLVRIVSSSVGHVALMGLPAFLLLGLMCHDPCVERLPVLVGAHSDVGSRHPDFIAHKRGAARHRHAQLVVLNFPPPGPRASRF